MFRHNPRTTDHAKGPLKSRRLVTGLRRFPETKRETSSTIYPFFSVMASGRSPMKSSRICPSLISDFWRMNSE